MQGDDKADVGQMVGYYSQRYDIDIMANTSKIIKYNLEDETLRLKEAGLSLDEIRNTLKNNHSDITDLQNLSMMSLSRFFDAHKTEEALEKLKNGDDPLEDLRSEFRDKMYDLHDETQDIYKIMKKSLKKIARSDDDYKVIKAAKDTINAIEQCRKNWTSLIQFGVNEFKPLEKAQEINIVEVHNLLINVSKDLCPECRRKIVGYVVAEEENNG